MKYFSIRLLLAVLIFSCAKNSSAQSSDDFTGNWVGYVKVNDQPQYRVFIAFSNPEKKNITGVVNVYDYKNVKKLVVGKTLVFEYDKQKQMAYVNTTLPSTEGKECGGWFTLRKIKGNADSVEVDFRTNKDCMKADIVISRSNYFYAKDPTFNSVALTSFPPDKNMENAVAKPGKKLFTSPDLMYQFFYPSGWELHSTSNGSQVQLTYPVNYPSEDFYRMEASQQDLSDAVYKNFNIEVYKKLREKQILALGPDIKILKLETRNAQNYPGIYIEFTDTDSTYFHSIEWDVFLEKRKLGILYQQRTAAKNDTMIKTAVNMIQSFYFNGQPSVQNTVEKTTGKPTEKTEPVVTKPGTADKKEANEEEVALFFKEVKGISKEDQLKIYKALNFKLNENKTFREGTYGSFTPEVSVTDLNGDKINEVIVLWSLDAGYPNTNMFIKSGNEYIKGLAVGGEIAEVIPDIHNGFPDLSFGSSGMETPIWRYDGYSYSYLKSVKDADYKKLKPVSIEEFQKNRTKYLVGKDADGAPTLGSFNLAPPTAATKNYIYRRWKTSDLIGSGRDAFLRMKERKEVTEMEFAKNGKCYLYKNGVLNEVLMFELAPDGKSMLFSKNGQSMSAPAQILSLKANELILKSFMSDNDIMIFRTN